MKKTGVLNKIEGEEIHSNHASDCLSDFCCLLITKFLAELELGLLNLGLIYNK